MSVSVLVPAYRATATLAATVAATRSLPGVTEVIVIDDGSGDGTSEAARAAGADQVLTLPRNLGKGGALRAGLPLATGETVLFLDSDLGDSAAHAAPLLEALADLPAMSVAVFPKTGRSGGFGFAKGLAIAVIRLFTGLRVTAPLSGQRAMPTEVPLTTGIAPRWGVEVALTVEAAHLGIPIIEQPVPLDHHHTGRDAAGFRHRFAQFHGVLRYTLGVGYGLSWPALTKKQVGTRVAVWLVAMLSLIGLGLYYPLGWTVPFEIMWSWRGAPPSSAYVDAYILHRTHTLPAATILLLLCLASLVLWLPSLWISAVTLGCRKTNYLGRRIPGAVGLLIPLLALPASQLGYIALGLGRPLAILVTGFAALGLLDDLFGHLGQARGLRGHLRALLRGHLTTGAVKAIGGLAVALVIGYLHSGVNVRALLDGLVIALSANAFNLLDLRPGRSLKGFFLLALPLLLWQPALLPILGPALAAALVLAPADFSGRVMLGDVGANTLGASGGPIAGLRAPTALSLRRAALSRGNPPLLRTRPPSPPSSREPRPALA